MCSVYEDEEAEDLVQASVFAITMACLDVPYEAQAWNFLQEGMVTAMAIGF